MSSVLTRLDGRIVPGALRRPILPTRAVQETRATLGSELKALDVEETEETS